MAANLKVAAGVTAFLGWLFIVLACGIPMFSAFHIDSLPLVAVDVDITAGRGIWGFGVAVGDTGPSKTICFTLTGTNSDTCNLYTTYFSLQKDCEDDTYMEEIVKLAGIECKDAYPGWMKGAQAAACISALAAALAVLLGCCGLTLTAGLFALVSSLVSIAPFASWEENVCGTQTDGTSVEVADCDRSYSYGLQVVGFLAMLIASLLFCVARRRGYDSIN